AVRSIRAMVASGMGENIKVETNFADENLMALADLHQLEIAILNLALNARDAMPDGGTLTLTTASVHIGIERPGDIAHRDYILLPVADRGGGMTGERVERAFEPFFTTKPSGAGTGLGLSMVYGFVNQSGRHVEIESVEGLGAAIRLYLPRAPHATDAHRLR